MSEQAENTIITRIDVLEDRITARLDDIEGKVDSHTLDIAHAKGGIKAARWFFTALVSIAGLLGLSHVYKQ